MFSVYTTIANENTFWNPHNPPEFLTFSGHEKWRIEEKIIVRTVSDKKEKYFFHSLTENCSKIYVNSKKTKAIYLIFADTEKAGDFLKTSSMRAQILRMIKYGEYTSSTTISNVESSEDPDSDELCLEFENPEFVYSPIRTCYGWSVDDLIGISPPKWFSGEFQ